MLLTVQVLADSSSISRSGSPTNCRAHIGGDLRRDFRGGLVDVVAPDNQPLIPGDAPWRTSPMPMPPDIGAGLHHPVEEPRGPVGRHIWTGSARNRMFIDPADAHLSLEKGRPRSSATPGIAPTPGCPPAGGARKIWRGLKIRTDGDVLPVRRSRTRSSSPRRHLAYGICTPSTSAPGCRANRRS